MDLTPFSPDEAAEIAEDFEDLIDTEFTLGGVGYLIEDILICPFNANEREEWLVGYADGVTTMTCDEVDVYLAVSDEGGTISYMSIRNFAAEKGIGYQFPGLIKQRMTTNDGGKCLRYFPFIFEESNDANE